MVASGLGLRPRGIRASSRPNPWARSARLMPVDRSGRQQVGAERASQQGSGWMRSRPATVPGRCPYRCPSHAASTPDPRWRCCRSSRLRRRGSRRARQSSTQTSLTPTFERRKDIREPLSAGVVEVCGQLDSRELLKGAREQRANLQWVSHSGGVAKADLTGTRSRQTRSDLIHALRRHIPVVRAAE